MREKHRHRKGDRSGISPIPDAQKKDAAKSLTSANTASL